MSPSYVSGDAAFPKTWDNLTQSFLMQGLLSGAETDRTPATKDHDRRRQRSQVLWEMEAGLGNLLAKASSDVQAQHPGPVTERQLCSRHDRGQEGDPVCTQGPHLKEEVA